jgi:phage repressor protein C with HTH and peptisase S24 domain
MNARWEKGTLDEMGNRAARIKQVRKQARLSQEKFAEALGEVEGIRITRGAVGNWELGGGISRANLAAISDKFDVDLNWLERGKGQEPAPVESKTDTNVTPKGIVSGTGQLISKDVTPVQNARIGAPIEGYTRVPIRGQGMGGKEGALIFTADDNFGEIEAPPRLHRVPDAYAVYVRGDSMLERFKHGEVVYVHPYEPYKKDDDVVIQVQATEAGVVVGYIKRFVSMDDRSLKVRQLHPKKLLTFPRNTVVAVHKVVFSGSV